MAPQDDVQPEKKRKQRFGWYALSSGFLGATASCCAKFALDPESRLFHSAHDIICSNVDIDVVVANQRSCFWIAFVLSRGFCLVIMILCNGYMLGTFLKGMEESGSVAGTALSTASNFLTSATYGYFLRNERFTLLWWAGFTLVCTGVALISVFSANYVGQDTTNNRAKQE